MKALRDRIGPNAVHLCVDMQQLFNEGSPWAMLWMGRVLPMVVRLAEGHPERTIFTRFIPADQPGDGRGTWRRYYTKWAEMTLERLDPAMLELAAPLARFVPPAGVVDKRVYSPWPEGRLLRRLSDAHVDTLVISGGETDVCVLATVLGAVDYGYRVVIATDAVCSSSDETHDALLALYGRRFGEQIETATVEEILDAWAGPT